jgi:hypothetical protein
MTPHRTWLALFVVVASALSGCSIQFQYRDEWVAALRSRAAFEMNCPEPYVRVTALTQQTFGVTNVPMYQGVDACGRRAVYVATASGYILNSAPGDGFAAQPPPTPPFPPPPPSPH